AALVVTAALQAALDALDQSDVLDLQNLVDVADRVLLLGARGRLLHVELEDVARLLRPDRHMVEDVDVGCTREDLDGEVGPEPPGAELPRPVLAAVVIGAALAVARSSAMTGIDAVADGAVALHVHEVAEIRMRHVAVITFEEIVDRVLPVPGDV